MARFTSTSRILLVFAVCIAAGAAAAAGYALTAPKHYRATAQILVAPVSPSDPTFAGLSVLRDTGGKRTAASSVAALLQGPQVADAVAASLALHRSRSALEHALHVHVVGSSDVVDVTAQDSTATGAAELANSFAGALIAQRSATFQSELSSAVRRDEQVLAASPGSTAIARRLTTLKGFVGQPDPTLRVASEAATPTAASGPNVARLTGLGAAVGAAAGLALALALLLLLAVGSRARQYDRTMSDRAAEKLADRLEARLAAREAALAARERDLQAKLDELRAAQQEQDSQPPPEPVAADDSDLRRREAELAERVAAVTKRELELGRRVAELAVREREREREREHERERERERERQRQEAEAKAAAAPPPAAPPPQPVSDGQPGAYSLSELEALVAARRGEHPDRVDEWDSYLFFLRDYAAADGRIPASFDWLVEETFAEIL